MARPIEAQLIQINALLEESYLVEIGKIAVEHEALNEVVCHLIWALAFGVERWDDFETVGRSMLTDLDFGQRVKLARKLGESEKPELWPLLDPILQDAKAAGTVRNDRIHALWETYFAAGGIPREVSTRYKRDRAKERTILHSKLVNDVETIRRAANTLVSFCVARGIFAP